MTGERGAAPALETAIIVPYFGQTPPWIDLFLRSCEANPGFRWLLVGDIAVRDPPGNVTHLPVGLAEYWAHVGAILGLDLVGLPAYKLCDLKPALGLVHSDFVGDAAFWGYGDLDVVYGDLARAFAPLQRAHDVISAHTYLISGHFALFRNDPMLKSLFTAVADWDRRLASPVHRHFDEKAMSALLFGALDRRMLRFAPRVILDFEIEGRAFTAVCEEQFSTFNRPWLLPGGRFGAVSEWRWSAGRLTCDAIPGRDMAYAHFSNWNSGRWAQGMGGAEPWSVRGVHVDPGLGRHSDRFRITAEGFLRA